MNRSRLIASAGKRDEGRIGERISNLAVLLQVVPVLTGGKRAPDEERTNGKGGFRAVVLRA